MKAYAAISTNGTVAVFGGKPVWDDDGYKPNTSLEHWFAQIVFQLNCILTPEQAKESLREVSTEWERFIETVKGL